MMHINVNATVCNTMFSLSLIQAITFQFELSKRKRIQEDFKLTPGGHHRREIVKLQTIIHSPLFWFSLTQINNVKDVL